MTEKEFETYLKSLTTWKDHQYACEAWDSMTEAEKKNCTPVVMSAYIDDTYCAIDETEGIEEYNN